MYKYLINDKECIQKIYNYQDGDLFKSISFLYKGDIPMAIVEHGRTGRLYDVPLNTLSYYG